MNETYLVLSAMSVTVLYVVSLIKHVGSLQPEQRSERRICVRPSRTHVNGGIVHQLYESNDIFSSPRLQRRRNINIPHR